MPTRITKKQYKQIKRALKKKVWYEPTLWQVATKVGCSSSVVGRVKRTKNWQDYKNTK